MSLEVLIWIALAVLLVMGTPIFVSLGMASITVLQMCIRDRAKAGFCTSLHSIYWERACRKRKNILY